MTVNTMKNSPREYVGFATDCFSMIRAQKFMLSDSSHYLNTSAH